MATNGRRRTRYREDPDYRRSRIEYALARRASQRAERERIKRLRGWQTIDSAPENEAIILYDPKVFWPVVASWDGKGWACVHYEGPPLRPTHWRPILQLPLP